MYTNVLKLSSALEKLFLGEALWRRLIGIEPDICVCGTKIKVVVSVTDSDQIAEFMLAMRVAATSPSPARVRRKLGELNYIYDEV